jgi:hypothetical protein
MQKNLLIVFVAILCSHWLQAQKLTLKNIPGKWQIAALIADGKTIPLESEDSLRAFMYRQVEVQQNIPGNAPAVLSKSDSGGVEMGVKMLAMFRQSDMAFMANKTFRFSLSVAGTNKDMKGTWVFNEATQVIRLTELKKGKPVKSDIVKVLVKGEQLLLQMDKNKEEGFLLSKIK